MVTKIASLAPGKYRPFVRWLNDTFGLDLFTNLNFRKGFCLGGVQFMPKDGPKLRELLDSLAPDEPDELAESPCDSLDSVIVELAESPCDSPDSVIVESAESPCDSLEETSQF